MLGSGGGMSNNYIDTEMNVGGIHGAGGNIGV